MPVVPNRRFPRRCATRTLSPIPSFHFLRRIFIKGIAERATGVHSRAVHIRAIEEEPCFYVFGRQFADKFKIEIDGRTSSQLGIDHQSPRRIVRCVGNFEIATFFTFHSFKGQRVVDTVNIFHACVVAEIVIELYVLINGIQRMIPRGSYHRACRNRFARTFGI